jgi:hypothetical protein
MIIANTPEAIDAEKTTVQIKTHGSDWIKIENALKIAISKRIIRLTENYFLDKVHAR